LGAIDIDELTRCFKAAQERKFTREFLWKGSSDTDLNAKPTP
jgi:hypothetical protein